jgi:hypothetical protein
VYEGDVSGKPFGSMRDDVFEKFKVRNREYCG